MLDYKKGLSCINENSLLKSFLKLDFELLNKASTPIDPYVQVTTKEYDEINGKENDDKLLEDPTVYR